MCYTARGNCSKMKVREVLVDNFFNVNTVNYLVQYASVESAMAVLLYLFCCFVFSTLRCCSTAVCCRNTLYLAYAIALFLQRVCLKFLVKSLVRKKVCTVRVKLLFNDSWYTCYTTWMTSSSSAPLAHLRARNPSLAFVGCVGS